MKTLLWLAKPTVQTAFNGAMTLIWLVMMPITLLFIGPFSTVLWVSFISAWALFATHLGAWIAALVNVRAERIEGTGKDHAAIVLDHLEAASDARDAADAKRDQILAHLEELVARLAP